jgi:hypothetical protein
VITGTRLRAAAYATPVVTWTAMLSS